MDRYEQGKQALADFLRAWTAHEDLWGSSLNLIASENLPNKLVYDLLASDIGNRVAEGPHGDRLFPGLHHYDRIEELGATICRTLFSCEEAELRPISGTLANVIVFQTFLEPGGRLLTLSVTNGGHVSMAGRLPVKLGYEVHTLPFSADSLNINVDAALEVVHDIRPQLLLLGGSVILFPQPIRPLVEAAKAYGATIVFDGAHVAGLIAGGKYPNPLVEGADLLTFTTCKTIPGPQHAFIVGSREHVRRAMRTATLFHSGHHLHATVAAIFSCIELVAFGEQYAEQVRCNARALADALSSSGLDVVRRTDGSPTETHMLLIDTRRFGGGAVAETRLAEAQIFVNRNFLPFDSPSNFRNPSGIRLGTAEITRLGMTVPDMATVASFFVRALEDSSSAALASQVREFRKTFASLHYCFPYEEIRSTLR